MGRARAAVAAGGGRRRRARARGRGPARRARGGGRSRSLVAELHGSRDSAAELPAGRADELAGLPAALAPTAPARGRPRRAARARRRSPGRSSSSARAAVRRDERLAPQLVADHWRSRSGCGSARGTAACRRLARARRRRARRGADERAARRSGSLGWRRGPPARSRPGSGARTTTASCWSRATAAGPPPARGRGRDRADPRRTRPSSSSPTAGRDGAARRAAARRAAAPLPARPRPGRRHLAGSTASPFARAHALRAGERVREAGGELERSRALLEVLGQAISQLSLAHTLETAAERVAELLGTDRVAVYLIEDRRLVARCGAALEDRTRRSRSGCSSWRSAPSVAAACCRPDVAASRGSPRARARARGAGIGAAVALPLVVAGAVTGLLAAYPSRGGCRPTRSRRSSSRSRPSSPWRSRTPGCTSRRRRSAPSSSRRSRRSALRAPARRALRDLALVRPEPLARDDARRRGREDGRRDARGRRRRHPAARRRAGRSSSCARSTSASRGSPRSRARCSRGRSRSRAPRSARAAVAAAARPDRRALGRELGGAYALLAPFLAKGSTAAVLPIATPTEVLGTMTLVSFEADRPIDEETVAAALSIAGQAALALDNAGSTSSRRSSRTRCSARCCRRSAPTLPGLDLGAVYDSAAVDVGGDVYDFLTLADGRLAVVLGDVTGHGVEATADMAMAKYVFRRSRASTPTRASSWRRERRRRRRDRAGQVHHHGRARDRGRRARPPHLRLRGPSGAAARAAGRTRRGVPVRGLALGIDAGRSTKRAERLPAGLGGGRLHGRRHRGPARRRALRRRAARPGARREHDRPAGGDRRGGAGGLPRVRGRRARTDDCAVVVIARR